MNERARTGREEQIGAMRLPAENCRLVRQPLCSSTASQLRHRHLTSLPVRDYILATEGHNSHCLCSVALFLPTPLTSTCARAAERYPSIADSSRREVCNKITAIFL